MTTAIRRRLEALEEQTGPQGESPTILVHFVRPGEPVGKASSLQSLDGVSVDRDDGESVADFVARAAAVVRGAGDGPVVLLAGA
ncbi:MAG: hypothetical protein M9951_16860 [Burkholderiaceae bacterium]|nr:hypothetical protein [Burkholderiaceae bacterium]